MTLADEILELMKTNCDNSFDEVILITPERASAVASIFIQREVAKTQTAARNRELLGVAGRIMAGMYSDPDHWSNPNKMAVEAVEAAIALLQEINDVKEDANVT